MACVSKLTPAPYEKAQTSEEMIYGMWLQRTLTEWHVACGRRASPQARQPWSGSQMNLLPGWP